MASKNQNNCFFVYSIFKNLTTEKFILSEIINLNNAIRKLTFNAKEFTQDTEQTLQQANLGLNKQLIVIIQDKLFEK